MGLRKMETKSSEPRRLVRIDEFKRLIEKVESEEAASNLIDQILTEADMCPENHKSEYVYLAIRLVEMYPNLRGKHWDMIGEYLTE